MPMTTASQSAPRDELITDFLTQAGFADATPSLLAGDASNRRYLRIAHPTGRYVLMDAPSDRGEDVRPFVAMTDWLRGHGYAAPQILAADLEAGFLLLEDLGDALYARVIGTEGVDEVELYACAVDCLASIAGHRPPATVGSGAAQLALQPYDRDVLHREALLMLEWWMSGASGQLVSQDLTDEFTGLLDASLGAVAQSTEVVVLRDFHAENLLWLPDRTGHARVGLLDYQDALAGSAAYDLVSLLEDARRDTSPELRSAMFDRYLDRRSHLDRDDFSASYNALGAQRNLKIVGIFARLAIRDRKAKYLDLIPRVWGHLLRDLTHPSLAPLSRWVARNVPEPTPATLARVASASIE